MQVKDLLTDDDAVSPVIGVILMVAITVILAAVIAAFVLGLGDTNDVAPNTSFEYDFDASGSSPYSLDVRVRSGDTFNSDRISFEGEDLGTDEGATWTDTDGDLTGTSDISSGADVTLGNIQSESFLLEITWTSEEGGTSSVISTREGPER
jgi:flagellin-like protein